ncbi:MAG TPA: TolC family protein [Acidiferrobacteraceae bacterium]|nr:TolC family protein [Acidiferrobacteraceae bacterium]
MSLLRRPTFGLLVLSIFIHSIVVAAPVVAASEADNGSGQTTVLNRETAVNLAIKNNPSLLGARQKVVAARARRLQADGFESPSVTWEWEEARQLDKPGQFGNQIYGVEQSLEWPVLRHRRKQAADLGIDAAAARSERRRLQIIAQVNKAFDQVLLTDAVYDLLQEMARRTAEAVDISRVRVKGGTGKYVDLLRTRIARERLQNEARDTKVRLAAAHRQLNILLGSDRAYTIKGELTFGALSVGQRDWFARAQQQGPTALLIQHRIAQSKKEIDVARANRFPELTLGLGRQRLRDNTRNEYAWAGVIGLKFPIPGTDRQRGLENEARASANAVQYTAQTLQYETQARLQQRIDEAITLETQIENYRDRILPDVDDQLKAARQEYSVRRIDALNLLDVYTTYLETRRSYLQALVRYRAAQTDLDTLGEDLWEVDL